MKAYLDLLRRTLEDGTRQKNRTGIDTFMIPGAELKFDLAGGFPILTTKHVNFNAVKAELIGFIRGYDSAAAFRELGTKIWDANANDPMSNGGKWYKSLYRQGEDDLGRIYGVQWRRWESGHHKLDQLARALDMIIKDPTSRRIIVSAWKPDELDQMALPPCHLLFQLLLEQETRRLHMCMYQRSCDLFLGVPFNISSYALLLHLIAFVTGCWPGVLTMFLADVHIYENHLDQVKVQLARETRGLPQLQIEFDTEEFDNRTPLQRLEYIQPNDIWLQGYDHAPAIKAPMAV